MDRHIIELTAHQHLPALLSLLVGLFTVKKDSFLYIDDESPGDNIPVTLMEGVMQREDLNRNSQRSLL